MKNIMKYENFKKLNEAYEEDPEYRIKTYFVELEKKIKNWFSEGSFSLKNVVLYDIKTNTTNNLDKYLTFDFQDDSFYYLIIVIISLQEVSEDTLKECYIKIKRYDAETSELLKQSSKSLMVDDLNEDKIIELISDLDNEDSTESSSEDTTDDTIF